MNYNSIALLQTMLRFQEFGIRLLRKDPALIELQNEGLVSTVHEEAPYIWVKASQKALDEKEEWLKQKPLSE